MEANPSIGDVIESTALTDDNKKKSVKKNNLMKNTKGNIISVTVSNYILFILFLCYKSILN
jgi:hypothetical protein